LPTKAVLPQGPRISFPAGQVHDLAMPDGSRRAVTSLLNVPGRMTYGQFVWNEEGVPAGKVWIRVDLAAQTLSVFRDGNEIGTSVILYGADEKKTPTGVFPILAKSAKHRSSLYDAEMPYMLRLTGDGVAIHGSDVREGAATHGCIGVPVAFAARLFAQAKQGDEVIVLPAA
jgi:hypothetical protein